MEKSKNNKQQMKEEIQQMGVVSDSPRPIPLDEKGAGTLIRWRGCVKAKRWISKCAWDGVITGRRTRESKRYRGGEKDWEREMESSSKLIEGQPAQNKEKRNGLYVSSEL